MATGSIKSIPQIKVLNDALTFSSSDAEQSVTFSQYIGWFLLDAYTNSMHTSLSANSFVENMEWSSATGKFIIKRGNAGYWPGAKVSLVLIKP